MPTAAPAPGRSPWAPRAVPNTPGATTPEADPSRADPAPIRHAYDLQRYGHLVGADGEGAENLQGFADTMHQSGAAQAAVDGVLDWWSTAVAGKPVTWEGFADAIGGNPETIAPVLSWYAGRLIEDGSRATPDDIRAARNYVKQLPPEMIEALKVVGADGRAPGNDPRVIRLFARYARESPAKQPSAPTKLPTEEREAIELTLRTDRARYNRDPQMQARYRDLLANPPAEKPLPSGAAAIDKEIGELEAFMREHRSRWFADEARQKRYRELLAIRGGR